MYIFLRAFIAFAGTTVVLLLLFELWTINTTRLATVPVFDGSPRSSLEELRRALRSMQDNHFQLWLGTWPSAIDWTAAVIGTHLTASLHSMSRSLEYQLPPRVRAPAAVTAESHRVENEINKYFSQAASFYFGQDAFGIRGQAFDDILWVVLGWLDNIRFIYIHDEAHYQTQGDDWHGKQFTDAFAHRARVFYDIAKKGWDTDKCGGGMNWNPRLLPYKNAITNQLFISASVNMYLYFPGDSNSSPFSKFETTTELGMNESVLAARPHSREYLKNAVKGYDWLAGSNMLNYQGLYVDGFHISHRNGRYICDIRNEMVYTYNQGVILSGLRGLWESTNKTRYLEDGYRLVNNVIHATGFNLSMARPYADGDRWQGLGRAGVLEDQCDAAGRCSQDGQNFKGIFMHHLTHFCEPLPTAPRVPGISFAADPVLAARHGGRCASYTPWVVHNARAALATRDARGAFGMWWGAGLPDPLPPHGGDGGDELLPYGAEDYRNRGLGDVRRWGRGWAPVTGPPPAPLLPPVPVGGAKARQSGGQATMGVGVEDVNDRGRGRTVETQGAGVSVVRALWEFLSEHTGA
jgi:hypothetical protein